MKLLIKYKERRKGGWEGEINRKIKKANLEENITQANSRKSLGKLCNVQVVNHNMDLKVQKDDKIV